ncbi:vWA domain-containing protein [Phenylobacterium sp.]|uniref:vWA domain-containing protein n=1 Tax=Phenylobacterium sp. TaxID=1871053 RepID=UPI002C109897|nr:VWA domain-containing protein [Phenylobacterium sp.]HVI33713.1 VWA domain-containing protein [Phenylobacterium sp.]
MSLLWPQMLWLALLAPSLIAAEWLLARRRRGSAAAGFVHIRRGVAAGGRVSFDPAAAGAAAASWRLWAAFLLIVLALARPQWGQAPRAPDAEAPGEVLIALDLSRSMLAQDVAPTRLERARALAARLAEDLPDRRVGLIAFAGSAHLLAPPSEDRAVLRAYLPRMAPEHMPEPGTSFPDLLDVALAGFSAAPQGRALVVLSDGEAEPGSWDAQASALRRNGVQVVAVGVGTEGGGPVMLAVDRPVRTPAGAPVVSRLDPGALRALAASTGGRYLDMAGAAGLADAVRAASALPPEGAARAPEARPARADRFAWFAAAALVLLAWSAVTEFTARPRLRRRRAAAKAALAAALLAAVTPLGTQAAAPLLTETDLQGEKDPLEQLKEVVAELVGKPALGAGDYLRVAEAASRYGEIHRGHGHGLEEGVLRDGLAAVAAGRRLDADLADWGRLQAKLERLLEPPPLVPPDPGPHDPANEPVGAEGAAPPPGEDARDSRDEEAGQDDKAPTAGEQGLQNVGGSERDAYDAAEWREPALVQTLDQLQRLRAADSPAELFALMNARRRAARPREQTW